MRSKFLPVVLVFAFAMLALTACGSKPATISELPIYPGATALQPGQDPIADTLVQNMSQDAALRSSLGVGGQIEQQAFRLPEGTTWDDVRSYFDTQLGDAGWKNGAGGIGGDLVSSALDAANTGNDLFQTTLWSKGKQSLTAIRTVNPTNDTQPYLILSLSTN